MMNAFQDLNNSISLRKNMNCRFWLAGLPAIFSTSDEVVFFNKKYRTYFVSIKAGETKYLSDHDYLNLSKFSWAAYWEVVAVSESMGRQMRSSTCLTDRLTAVSV
jgi:hypothetical protein